MWIDIGNIVLREWKEDDIESLARIANNKKIFDNLRDAFPHPYTFEDARNYISRVTNDDKTSKIFAIEVDGKIAGNIGIFFKQDIYRKNAEIGYFLAEEWWGKGVMTKVIRAVVDYSFENFDIVRIYAEPFAENVGSRKVLEKVGFRLEAVLKNDVIKNGIIQDSCIYSLLKEEFKR